MQTRGIRYFIKQGVKKNNHYAPLPGGATGVGDGGATGVGDGRVGAPGTFGSIGVSGPLPGFVFGHVFAEVLSGLLPTYPTAPKRPD